MLVPWRIAIFGCEIIKWKLWLAEEGWKRGLDVEHLSYWSHIMFKSHIYKYCALYPSQNTHRSTYQNKTPSKKRLHNFFLVKLFPGTNPPATRCDEYQFDVFRFDGVTWRWQSGSVVAPAFETNRKLVLEGIAVFETILLHFFELPYFRRLKLGCKLKRDMFTTAMNAYCK